MNIPFVKMHANGNDFVIIDNRTKNFLDENYGDKFVVRYLDILDEQFGISAQQFEMTDVEDAPFAVGANPAGAGMGGG